MAENESTQDETEETEENAEVEAHVLDYQDLGPKSASPQMSCLSINSVLDAN